MFDVRRRVLTLSLAGLVSLTLLSTSGCAGALMMPFYLINGTDAPAVYKNEMKAIPKGSKMVVICRTNLNLYGTSNPSADLSVALTHVISTEMKSAKKKKLEWIPFSRVEEEFEDEEEFKSQSFEKMGKAVGADYVIGVDIDSFDIHHSTQFYQGNAKVLVRMVKVSEADTIVRQSMPSYVYPPTPIPRGDLEETDFQKRYVVKLARHIATLFCPHDPHAEYAADSDFADR